MRITDCGLRNECGSRSAERRMLSEECRVKKEERRRGGLDDIHSASFVLSWFISSQVGEAGAPVRVDERELLRSERVPARRGAALEGEGVAQGA